VRLAGHVEAADPGGPGVRAQQGGQDPDGGGLAGAVRAEHAQHGARSRGQVHPVERQRVTEPFGEAHGLERVRHVCSSSHRCVVGTERAVRP
jgi:hypothetical protein